MTRTDSALTAAKIVAECTGLEWATVQKYYRDLQGTPNMGDAWVPRSVGRTVWFAHPHFTGRLLTALATMDSPHGSNSVMEWAQTLCLKKASGDYHDALQSQLNHFLSSPENADTLENVEFRRDQNSVIFRLKDGHKIAYVAPNNGNKISPINSMRIQKRGVIAGEVFQDLSRKITWRGDNQPPYVGASLDDPDFR